MSTKFDRKIKKKFFVPLIAKNWNNNNYYSDDNNQKKKKNFTLRTNRNRNLFPSSSYFPKYTKEHSNKITGQYQQNSKTENPSILADASFEDGKVEISLSLSLFPSSRFTFPPFRPFLSLSLPLSFSLSLPYNPCPSGDFVVSPRSFIRTLATPIVAVSFRARCYYSALKGLPLNVPKQIRPHPSRFYPRGFTKLPTR